MERVLNKAVDIMKAYYNMNISVGNEKQTCLNQVKDIMSEKWGSLCDIWIPKYAEECPMDKCYKEEFTSFYSLNNKKDIDVSVEYTEEPVKGEVETLEVDVPQKKL